MRKKELPHFRMVIRRFWPILIPVAVLAIFITLTPFAGLVGTAIGSFEGVTKGRFDGAEAGKIAGLSAEDTTVKISSTIKQTGNLQVLLVEMNLADIYTQGKKDDPTYAALFNLSGEGVFTVDLTQSEVVKNAETGEIVIGIPRLVFTPYLDDSSITTVAEYNPHKIFNGSTENGYTGWLNSRERINQEVQKEFAEDEALLAQAEGSALKQVQQLAESVCGDKTIVVQFFEEG